MPTANGGCGRGGRGCVRADEVLVVVVGASDVLATVVLATVIGALAVLALAGVELPPPQPASATTPSAIAPITTAGTRISAQVYGEEVPIFDGEVALRRAVHVRQ